MHRICKLWSAHRYVRKQKESPFAEVRMTPNYETRLIFPTELEIQLADYASSIGEALNVNDFLKYAFDIAGKHNLKMPDGWKQRGAAGYAWFRGFRTRFPQVLV